MPKHIVNELDPELTSMSALNQFTPNVHASRGAMFTGNLGQWLVINGATPRLIYSGVEQAYGEATFSQGFDRDVEIIKTIARFPDAGHPGVPAKINPSTLVIFEDYETKEIGCLELTEFHSTHQHFGFRYKKNEDVLAKLTPGRAIPAGTRVHQSPNLLPNGDYMFGLQCNVLFSSDPAVIEDGIKVSESFLERIIPTGYTTETFDFGKTHFPINLYGDYNDPDNYKAFPNIGETIGTDGLLACLRKHSDVVNVVNMTVNNICRPDYIYDRKKYGLADAKVVDIKVHRNTSINIPPMPVGTDRQLMWYWEADNSYYRKILDAYWDLRDGRLKRGSDMRMSPEFHDLVVQAIHRCGVDYRPEGRRVTREIKDLLDVRSEYRGVPLDAWHVEITYEHRSIPNDGFKLTDINGGFE